MITTACNIMESDVHIAVDEHGDVVVMTEEDYKSYSEEHKHCTWVASINKVTMKDIDSSPI